MPFYPAVPGFSPVSYGQTYGDWKQYAGYNKDNPFGVGPEISVKQNETAPVAPVAPPKIDAEMTTPDYSIAPPTGQFGFPATGQLGDSSGGMFKLPSLADQARKHYGS